MKYLAITLIALSLTACKEMNTINVDTTLTCEMPQENGENSVRTVNYKATFETRYSTNIGWEYSEGAWVVTDRWNNSRVFQSVTPRLGESCNTDK